MSVSRLERGNAEQYATIPPGTSKIELLPYKKGRMIVLVRFCNTDAVAQTVTLEINDGTTGFLHLSDKSLVAKETFDIDMCSVPLRAGEVLNLTVSAGNVIHATVFTLTSSESL